MAASIGGESQIGALHREVREETGWTIAAPRRIGAYRRFAWLPDHALWAEKVCHVWLARPVLCRGAPAEPMHRAIWRPLSALPDAISEPGARAFLGWWTGTQRQGGVHRAPAHDSATARQRDRPRNPG